VFGVPHMYISELDIENYVCIDHLSVSFTPGLNGVIGPNGSGKSTLLDALRFLIVGESNNECNRVENIQWGHDSALVRGTVVHNDGSKCFISRGIGRRDKHQLVYDSFEYIKKAEIEEFISRLFGVSMETLTNHVFIPQGAIDSILFNTQTRRLKEFQHTFGLQRAAEAEAALAREISKCSFTPGLDKQLLSTEEMAAKVKEEISALSVADTDLSCRISELDKYRVIVEKALSIKQKSVAFRQIKNRLSEIDSRILITQNDIANLTHIQKLELERKLSLQPIFDAAKIAMVNILAAEKERTRFDDINKRLSGIDRQLLELSSVTLHSDDQLRDMASKLTLLNSDIEVHKEQLTGKRPLPEMGEDRVLSTRLEELTSELNKKRIFTDEESRLKTVISLREEACKGPCPICHSLVSHDLLVGINESDKKYSDVLMSEGEEAWKNQCDAIRKEIHDIKSKITIRKEACRTALSSRIKKLELEASNLDKVISDTRSRMTLLMDLKRTKSILESEIAGYTPAEDIDKEGHEAVIAEYDSLSTRIMSVRSELSSKEKELVSLRESRTAASNELAELGEISDMPQERDIQEAQQQLAIMEQLLSERRRLRDEIASISVKQHQFDEAISRLKLQLKSEEKEARWVGLCKRVREILHVNGLPALMMREYVSHLNGRMKHYLDIWEAPFVFYLDENLAFKAKFRDGICSASILSGGQRIIASTSFRLAMVDTFAKDIGLLVLDEPSASLDSENKVHLQNLMLKLKNMAGDTGKQIILVTHEERYKGFFDNVIDLER